MRGGGGVIRRRGGRGIEESNPMKKTKRKTRSENSRDNAALRKSYQKERITYRGPTIKTSEHQKTATERWVTLKNSRRPKSTAARINDDEERRKRG